MMLLFFLKQSRRRVSDLHGLIDSYCAGVAMFYELPVVVAGTCHTKKFYLKYLAMVVYE